ncbi:MAG: prepilin-type N-terminal cleavage/methylation domain-containing protein [Candidatus Saccharibacteria bacterium]|nr:prepilin-type N-terminal cleavage/methylation domain-containing protein [Candidatus Saccharibacteria bacterium]
MKKLNLHHKNSKRSSGFTILELIIVIVIIGILAAVVIATYIGTVPSARDVGVQSDVDTMDGLQTNFGTKNNVSGKVYYGSGYDASLDFQPSSGNIIDVVINSTDYCIRGYNPAGTKNSITNSYIKESTSGVCGILSPSAAAYAGTPIKLPGDIAGLKLWLDASQITGKNNNDTLSTWSDLSGSGNSLTQGTVSNYPVYKTNIVKGKPAVHFAAASAQTMTVATNFTAPVTVIYVGRQSGGTNGRMLSGINNNWLLGFWGASRSQAYFEGWVSPVGTPGSDTNWHMYSAVITGAGTNTKVYADRTLVGSNQGGLQGPNGLTLMGEYGENSDGDITEVIIYNSAISDVNRSAIEDYLSNKYF